MSPVMVRIYMKIYDIILPKRIRGTFQLELLAITFSMVTVFGVGMIENGISYILMTD